MNWRTIRDRLARVEAAAKYRGLEKGDAEERERARLHKAWLRSLSDNELDQLTTAMGRLRFKLDPGASDWCRIPGCGCADVPPEGAFEETDEKALAAFQVKFETWQSAER